MVVVVVVNKNKNDSDYSKLNNILVNDFTQQFCVLH